MGFCQSCENQVTRFCKAWMQISHWLSDPRNLKSMRRLGTLGEGGFLMQNNLHGLGVERTVRYDVHQLNIPGWQSITGQSIEEVLGMKKGQKAILGYHNGNPVFANGQQNYIENVFETGQGVLGIEVRTANGPRASRAAAHIFPRARGEPGRPCPGFRIGFQLAAFSGPRQDRPPGSGLRWLGGPGSCPTPWRSPLVSRTLPVPVYLYIIEGEEPVFLLAASPPSTRRSAPRRPEPPVNSLRQTLAPTTLKLLRSSNHRGPRIP